MRDVFKGWAIFDSKGEIVEFKKELALYLFKYQAQVAAAEHDEKPGDYIAPVAIEVLRRIR